MSGELNQTSADLASAAEALLAEAAVDVVDATHAVQLATAHALLAIYCEIRQQAPGRIATVPDLIGRSQLKDRATEPGS
jgi:hypothetical protein